MLPLVAVATWNKESFLLIIPTLFPILRQKSSRVSALIGTGALALASAGVYFNLRLRFQGNPGGTVLHEWRDQLRFLAHPLNFLRWEKTYGIPAFKAFTLIPLILIVWTAFRGWRRLPLEIQRHGQIAALINFPLFFLFCAPGEIRDLSLLYIVFLLLLAANFTAEPKPLVEFKKDEVEQREFAEVAS